MRSAGAGSPRVARSWASVRSVAPRGDAVAVGVGVGSWTGVAVGVGVGSWTGAAVGVGVVSGTGVAVGVGSGTGD